MMGPMKTDFQNLQLVKVCIAWNVLTWIIFHHMTAFVMFFFIYTTLYKHINVELETKILPIFQQLWKLELAI